MSEDSVKQRISAYLRLLGNPYAKTQIEGFEDEPEVPTAQRAMVKSLTNEQRAYARVLENQYAVLSIAPEVFEDHRADNGKPNVPLERIQRAILSKADFIADCRRIFRLYIPSAEKGRLRPHHRHFISRNQNRNSIERYALVQELRKYDISIVPGINAQFNRERDVLTDQKLRQIERSVLKD